LASWDELFTAFDSAERARRELELREHAALEVQREHEAWAAAAECQLLEDLHATARHRAAELEARSGARVSVCQRDETPDAARTGLPHVTSLRFSLREADVAIYIHRPLTGMPMVHLMCAVPPDIALGRRRVVSLPGCQVVRRGSGFELERFELPGQSVSPSAVSVDELVYRAFELVLCLAAGLGPKRLCVDETRATLSRCGELRLGAANAQDARKR
jgi:hypothetical protein